MPQLAILSFVNSSKVVRQSFAGQELLEKAKGLQELWLWWRQSADALEELQVVLDYMLKKEAEHQDDDGEFHDFDIQDPPYDLGPLAVQLEVCEKFSTEMGTLLDEGRVVWERLRQSNLRFRAEKRIRAAMRDEREDDLAPDEALSAGEACGVNEAVISAGRELATNWRANHYKIALHDELFQAVKALRKHVEKRGKPGAGAPEQQRMRIAIAGSGLPSDNPLGLGGLEFAASMGTGQRGAARRGAPDQRRGAGARRLQQRAAGGGRPLGLRHRGSGAAGR